MAENESKRTVFKCEERIIKTENYKPDNDRKPPNGNPPSWIRADMSENGR